jgi:hypothetical protein
MKKREEQIHTALATWIKLQYPDVIFTSESSGIRVSMGIAVKMKKQRSVGALPDLIILEPRCVYHGLCLEIKKDKDEVYRKDGGFRVSEHIQEQAQMLDRLRRKGYFAEFGCGLTDCMAIIKGYLSQTDTAHNT